MGLSLPVVHMEEAVGQMLGQMLGQVLAQALAQILGQMLGQAMGHKHRSRLLTTHHILQFTLRQHLMRLQLFRYRRRHNRRRHDHYLIRLWLAPVHRAKSSLLVSISQDAILAARQT